MFDGRNGVKNRIRAMLVIDCEGSVYMLHLVSSAMVAQQSIAERNGLRRQPNGGMGKQIMELNMPEIGIGCYSQRFAAHLDKLVSENECRSHFVAHI